MLRIGAAVGLLVSSGVAAAAGVGVLVGTARGSTAVETAGVEMTAGVLLPDVRASVAPTETTAVVMTLAAVSAVRFMSVPRAVVCGSPCWGLTEHGVWQTTAHESNSSSAGCCGDLRADLDRPQR